MGTIVIGLDGATFDLFLPWVKEGKLPNLKKLVEEGTSAVQQSCLPPVTAPNWRCYSTGKNPGKLGIFWWENINRKNRRIELPQKSMHPVKEIWDYLGQDGKKVGIINMPLTYPPKRVNGFMISGVPGLRDENFTYPPELESRLKNDFGYTVYPRDYALIKKDSEKMTREVVRLIDTRFRVARSLCEEYSLDFLHLTIFYLNGLQHDYWNGKPVEEAWKAIDRNLAYWMEGNNNLFIISDHGSNEIKQVFYINAWLAREGYLRVNKKMKLSSFLYRLGLNMSTVLRILSWLHVTGLTSKLPETVRGLVPSVAGTADELRKADKVDWDKTRVLASGQGPIYILNQDGDEALAQELVMKLEDLANPTTGEKIARKVYRREEIYSGQFLPQAPDLMIDQALGTHTRGGVAVSGKGIFEKPQAWRAENKKEGTFIAYGPDIKRGCKLADTSILDVAPTLLHLMGSPVPDDMDGRVLTEIFRDDSPMATREVKYQAADDYETRREKDRVKEKVRRLSLKDKP